MLATFGFMPTESVVEGIGNELLFFVSFIGLVSFLVLAWMSTGVSWELLPVRITLVQQRPDNMDAAGDGALPIVSSEVPLHEDSRESDHSTSSSDEGTNDVGSASPQPGADTPADTLQITDSISCQVDPKNMPVDEQERYASRFRERGHLVIRLQYVNDRTRYVHASPNTPIERFKRKHFSDELTKQRKTVRLIFQGRELTEYDSALRREVDCTSQDPTHVRQPLRLCDYNVQDGSTIHCLITSAPAPPRPVNETQPGRPSNFNNRGRSSASNDSILAEFDMGTRLMEPLFAFLLAFTWFFRIVYRQYFNSVSTFALIALSVFFCGAVFAVNFMNATSTFITFASRRRNSREPSTADSSDSQNASLGNPRDMRVVTVTMVTRRLQRGHSEARSPDTPIATTTEMSAPPETTDYSSS